MATDPDASLSELSDPELVALCLQAGQRYDTAFEALYQRYADRVYGFLLKLTRDATAAEDALQETFLRVYRSLERFDTGRSLITWLLQIARYVAIDAHRVERKVKRLEERRAEERSRETGAPASLTAQARERQALVEEVLEELSMDDRSLLLLRHFQGMTFREIGAVADCSSRTAQNRVEAAGRRFQQALARRRVRGEGEL